MEEDFYGIQDADAKLLAGIVSMLAPRTVVEFGYGLGRSSAAMFPMMPSDSRLYSFDPNPNLEVGIKDSRFTLIPKRGEDLVWADIDQRMIDFIFLDASHELESNKQIFYYASKFLMPKAIIAVHDTGYWTKIHKEGFSEGKWLGHMYFHRPEEREFVEWMQSFGFQRIDFWTPNTMRHGMTLLQKP